MIKLRLVCMLASLILGNGACDERHCDPTDRGFVCGMTSAEDLVNLRGTKWIVASQFNIELRSVSPVEFNFLPGPVRAFRTDDRLPITVFPARDSTIRWDRNTYPDCSTPPLSMSSHGVNMLSLGKRGFRIYVVNHGERNSIEIIDVVDHTRWLQASWRGCVLVSKYELGIDPNGVASLPGDGIAVSGNGVATWFPSKGWRLLRKIEHSNGLEASSDGRTLFVAGGRARLIYRISVDEPVEMSSLEVDFNADNIRWGADGNLYAAGPYPVPQYEGELALKCIAQPVCTRGFVIARVDPHTFTVREVFRSGEEGIRDVFGLASSAVQIGKNVWLGTVRGDRVAVIPLEH